MALWIGTFLAMVGTVLLHAGKEERALKKRVMIQPPSHIEHMTLGYDDLVADGLWIRVIQDYDLCEASNANIFGSAVGKKCHEGWIFKMLDAITDLSPKFRMPYATGGSILSVMVEDFTGAERLLAKGEKQFPKDYVFPYRAAYNYIFGLKQPVDASAALIRASKLEGAPQWLPMLAARQAREGGEAELGIRILEDFASEHPEWEENPRLIQLKQDLVQQRKAELEPERSPTGRQSKSRKGKDSPQSSEQNSKTP